MITVKHGVFHLQNEKSSYLFRVRDGFLEHLHLGTRLSASDADALAVRPGNGWGDSTLYREGRFCSAVPRARTAARDQRRLRRWS